MKERPILFSGPMVRAILAGRKTVTRRIVGLDTLKPSETSGYDWTFRGRAPVRSIAGQLRHGGGCWQDLTAAKFLKLCPYGSAGDRLWVRETWRYHGWTEDGAPWIKYAADDSTRLCERIPDEWSDRLADIWADLSDDANMAIDGRAADRKWRPSIFLPRWASRITLEVVSVRVERLEITEEDAIAEGAQRFDNLPSTHPYGQDARWSMEAPTATDQCLGSARMAFANLWNKLNASRAPWLNDPWVWRVEFRVVRRAWALAPRAAERRA